MNQPMKLGALALDIVQQQGGNRNKSKFIREAVERFCSMADPVWIDSFRDSRLVSMACFEIDPLQYKHLKDRAKALGLNYVQAVEIGIFDLVTDPDFRPKKVIVAENQALKRGLAR